jgi:hypothetical protein
VTPANLWVAKLLIGQSDRWSSIPVLVFANSMCFGKSSSHSISVTDKVQGLLGQCALAMVATLGALATLNL